MVHELTHSQDGTPRWLSSSKYWTTLNIEPVPTAPKHAPTTPGNAEAENQYLVVVRYP